MMHGKPVHHTRWMGVGGAFVGVHLALKVIGVLAGAALMIYGPRLPLVSKTLILFVGVHLVGLAVVLTSLYALRGRAIAHRPRRSSSDGGVPMKKVTCPRCGAEFSTYSDDELVDIMQRHVKDVHQHNVARGHILKMAVVVGQEPALKRVVCSSCGAQFKSRSNDELVDIAQQHAKRIHEHDVTRDEIVKVITAT